MALNFNEMDGYMTPMTNSSYSKDYSGSDSGWSNSLADLKLNERLKPNNYMQSNYELSAFGPQGKNSFYNSLGQMKVDPEATGLSKYFTAPNMQAFGSAMEGLGSLASGWAALKNLGIQEKQLGITNDQWRQNYESQRTAVNNQIANQNAWKQAQGRTDYGSYVGGKPSGTNYVG